MRWSRTFSAMAIVTMLFSLSDCTSQYGPANMEFHRDEHILWSQQVAPAQKLALGPMALGLVSFEQIAPGTCWFRFQPDANPVVLATKLPGGQPGSSITLRRQVEAHLFARDPQEVFDTLASIGNDRATWLRETSVPSVLPSEPPPWSLPDDTVVPYPFAPHFIPKPTVLRPIVPLDFWHDAKDAVRAGPGNDPLGGSSVKALRVIPTGLCSTEQPIHDIVRQIVQGFFTTFLTATCKPRKLDGEIHYLDAVSYLGKHRPDRELPGDDDASGGFFLHSHVRLHDAGAAEPFSLTDCDIVSNYDYRFYLKDGRLAIAHTRHKYDYDASRSLCSGFLGNKGFADTLADALQLDIENEFFKVSSTRQLFTQPFSDTNWDCALGVPGGDACARAAAELQLAIGLGADGLGIPGGGPGSPADRLFAAAQRPENWQCTNYPTPPDACRGVGPLPRGRCEYIVRAKRLNVTPDTVELVWFDDVTEYDNPTFALFVASFAPSPTSNQVDFQAYRRLCSRNPSGVLAQTLVTDEPNNYYNRHFTRIRIDDSRCDALPREPPPDPPQCPCSSDRDCPTGVTCDLRTRLCKDLCFVDANCVFPQWQCYPELSRCGGSQCVNHAMCHSYEFCHSSGHCMKRR